MTSGKAEGQAEKHHSPFLPMKERVNPYALPIRFALKPRLPQLGELTGRGGTSNVVLIFVLIFGTISVIGILAAIALPAYQDYTVRAKLAEAAVVAKNASNAVERYYFQYKQVPSTIEETGFTTPRNPSYSGVSVDSQNGVVSILMTTSPIQGKSLLMVPSQATDGTLSWTCQSADIPQKYLPQGCRQ